MLALMLGAYPYGVGFAQAQETDVRRDATVAAVERVMPSVVNIATKSVVPVRDPFEQMQRQFLGLRPFDEMISAGSGVIIDENGYLLTNDHVVRGADQIGVKMSSGTNVYEAKVIAHNQKMDVALLKIEAPPGTKFKAIKLAPEDDLLLGETVLALGNPFGLGISVTRGILSSKSRQPPKQGERWDIPNWLQTDAPINPGNSGGPLVDLRGELIGINVAVLTEAYQRPAQGIGFAIPIRLVEEALSDIFPTEFVKSYWFGARVKVGSYPLVITLVQPDSPAGRAKLKVGDAVLQVNGKVPKNFIEFGNLLATNADADIPLTIRRGSELMDVTVRLVPQNSVFNGDMVRRKLGLDLAKNSDGFVITGVEDGGPADKAGLQRGMVVQAIDREAPPADLTGLAKLLYAKKKGAPVLFNVAVVEHVGNFNVLRQGTVEVAVR